MTTIDTRSRLFTLINVFTCEPDKQQQLVSVLTDATEKTMKRMPGFISANIHRSFDGKRVVNYAQWTDKASFEAMRKHPDAAPHMEASAKLANFDPITCEVVESISD